jgi:ABC-type oligopeptide transport system substrate-binding subunit
MKSKRLLASIVSAVLVLSTILTGCKKTDTTQPTETNVPKVLDYYVGDEPQTLDAQQMIGAPDMFVVNFLIEGLARAGKEEGKYEQE